MYAVYSYDLNSTPASVLGDLIKIITGETNKDNLSAQCVKANTSIISTVPAGWSVHDAFAASNAQVVRAINQDGITYKYCYWATTEGQLQQATYETWNASLHTGTFNTLLNIASWITTNAGGYLYIYATAKNIYVLPWNANGYSFACGCMEISRETIPSTYPCAVAIGSGFLFTTNPGAFISRKKNPIGSGDQKGAGLRTGPTYEPTSGLSANTLKYRDENDNVYLAATKICFSGYGEGSSAPLGYAYDVFCTGAAAGNTLDEIAYNGLTYVLLQVNTAAIILVPKA